MRTPEKRRSLQVGETVWRRLKVRALEEGVTVREVVERAVHRYVTEAASPGGLEARVVRGVLQAVERRDTPEGSVVRNPVTGERHWEPDEEG